MIVVGATGEFVKMARQLILDAKKRRSAPGGTKDDGRCRMDLHEIPALCRNDIVIL